AEDLFALWAHNDSRLRAFHPWPRRDPLRTKWQRGGNATESIGVIKLDRIAGDEVIAHLGIVFDRGDDIRPIGIEMPFQVELVAADKVPTITCAPNDQAGGRLLLHANGSSAHVVVVDFVQIG